MPRGFSFQFYPEFYTRKAAIGLDQLIIKEVENLSNAWELLKNGEVDAALLRTPFTDMAREEKLPFLADDRSLPWMSVLVLKQSVIKEKLEAVRKLVFGLEQSVLALNLKPDEFRSLLMEEGGIPKEARKKFPMPIFEGANAPAPDEIETIIAWLNEKDLLNKSTPYKALVNPEFLPNPKNVGLAFCCR